VVFLLFLVRDDLNPLVTALAAAEMDFDVARLVAERANLKGIALLVVAAHTSSRVLRRGVGHSVAGMGLLGHRPRRMFNNNASSAEETLQG
jgi:hypothetical protein